MDPEVPAPPPFELANDCDGEEGSPSLAHRVADMSQGNVADAELGIHPHHTKRIAQLMSTEESAHFILEGYPSRPIITASLFCLNASRMSSAVLARIID